MADSSDFSTLLRQVQKKGGNTDNMPDASTFIKQEAKKNSAAATRHSSIPRSMRDDMPSLPKKKLKVLGQNATAV